MARLSSEDYIKNVVYEKPAADIAPQLPLFPEFLADTSRPEGSRILINDKSVDLSPYGKILINDKSIDLSSKDILNTRHIAVASDGEIPSAKDVNISPAPLSHNNDNNFFLNEHGKKIFNLDIIDKELLEKLNYKQGKILNPTAQAAVENLLLENQGKCQIKYVDSLRARYYQFKPENFNNSITKQNMRFDSNFQNDTACLIDAMTTKSNSYSDILPDLRLRTFVNNTKMISSGAYGSATLLSNYNTPLFVVKNTKKDDEHDLEHEAFVGLAAINNLRDKIPNFVHTYGIYKCAPPVTNIPVDEKNPEILDYCPSPSPKFSYLIIENIDKSKSYKDMVEKLTPDEHVDIHLQVANAINVAYKAYDFTHYDLHSSNVLIQKFDDLLCIPIYLPDRILYLHTHYLARIIDFGYSHIKIDKYHFGPFDLENFNIFAYRSFPIHDIHKFLLFGFSPNITNEKYKRYMQILYDFYGTNKTIDERADIRRKQLENYKRNGSYVSDFYQPPTTMINLKLDDYLIHIVKNIKPDNLSMFADKNAIMTICGKDCISWDKFTNKIFVRDKSPSSIEEYSLALSTLGKMNNIDEYKRFMNSYDIEKVFPKEYRDTIVELTQHSDYIRQVNISVNYDLGFSYDDYYVSLCAVISFIAAFNKKSAWWMSVIYAYSSNNKLSTIKGQVMEMTKLLNTCKTIIKNYQNIIKLNMSDEEYLYDPKPEKLKRNIEIAERIILDVKIV